MSTMYDALRKAESERQKTSGPEKTVPTVRGMMEIVKTGLLLIAVIVVFVIAYYRFKGPSQGPMKQAAVQAASNVQAPALTTPGSTAVPSGNTQRVPGTYGLDGVIDAGADSMAIVNGKFLKVGGTIDSLILKKISPKEVELLNTKDNSVVVLKIE